MYAVSIPEIEGGILSSEIKEASCPFCKQSARYWRTGETIGCYGYDCEICGQFFISISLYEKIKEIRSVELINCIAENISSNAPRGVYPITTAWHSRLESELPTYDSLTIVKIFELFFDSPIVHSDKPTDLLNKLASITSKKSPFSKGQISLKDLYSLKINGFEEAYTWFKRLISEGLIVSDFFKKVEGVQQYVPSDRDLDGFYFQITPSGWEKVFSNKRSINSRTAFVAMQFNWGKDFEPVRIAYAEAVKAACRDCDFEAIIINEHQHNNQITDEIIAKIKSSRFIIADFTFNNRGAYYEAGLARGLNIPTIHTVMKGHVNDDNDKEKQLHFDIKQINYIEWETAENLRRLLSNRIKAVIEK